jgi:hypothetical protein
VDLSSGIEQENRQQAGTRKFAAETKQLQHVFDALGGITTSRGAVEVKPRRKMSKAARAKISAAQKKRRAKQRA